MALKRGLVRGSDIHCGELYHHTTTEKGNDMANPRTPEQLTTDWLNTSLTDGVFEGARITDFEISPVGASVGFLGDIFRVQPQYAAADESYPSSFIIKFPTVRDANRETGNSVYAYEREAMFYRHCANTNPANPPVHYHSAGTGRENEFLVVMEDLDGSRFVEQVRGIEPEDAMRVVKSLAGMHAFYWQSPQLASMEWLRSYGEWADIYPGQIETGWPLYKKYFSYVIPDEFLPLFPKANAMTADIFRYFHRERPMTLIHGDARMENVAFSEPDNEVRFYDWQLVSTGPGAYDLLYFFCSSLESAMWKRDGRELVKCYHDTLVAKGVSNYSAADLHEDMKLACCLFFGFVSVVGNMFADPGDAEKAVIEATSPRFWAVMEDLDVVGTVSDLEALVGSA